MPPELFRRCGRALFGHRWQEWMAEALAINPTTVRRWSRGDQIIPQAMRARLAALVSARREELAGLAEELGDDAL
jgi:hypothetical protein